MNIYFFFLFFLTNHFIFFICNFECIMTSTFFIIFVSLFLISYNMFLTFISCIIILNLSRQKVAIVMTFLIQKSFVFSIFLLLSEITLNIINFLNFYTLIMFFRAVNMIATSNSRNNIIIFFALIICTCFIFWAFFIYIISFIFLLDFRFNNALITCATSVKNVILKFSAATFA